MDCSATITEQPRENILYASLWTVRGRLPHFFANHELLATEIMALARLRFPDAPAAVRGGVWQTLKDEQSRDIATKPSLCT